MIQKVLIANHYGGNLPDIVSETMLEFGNTHPQCRIGRITEWVENTAVEYSDIFYGNVGDGTVLNEYLKDNPEELVRIGYNKYAGWCSATKHMASFLLEEVDTSKPWAIQEYDGAESICGVPMFKCVDESLNLYEEIKEDEYEDR